jgi:phospholipase C
MSTNLLTIARLAKRSALALFIGIMAVCGGGGSGSPPVPPGALGLARVRNVIIIMQENHSFDNYLGALPYAPGSPYHSGPCAASDNKCIDGLVCTTDAGGSLNCASNPEADGSPAVTAFHDPRLCIFPDLDHTWVGTHRELNFNDPNNALSGTNDGFVRLNDLTEQSDAPGEHGLTMTPSASILRPICLTTTRWLETFAVDDRYFASTQAQTVPNRLYELAGTSFGHLVTSVSESIPPPGGYQPIQGTIFDLLEKHGVTWGEYVETGGVTELGIPYGGLGTLRIRHTFKPWTTLCRRLTPAPYRPLHLSILGWAIASTLPLTSGQARLRWRA